MNFITYLSQIKKLLGIVVLGLFWCNVSFAQEIKLICKLTSDSQNDIQKKYGYKNELNVIEWSLYPEMPFVESKRTWEAAPAFLGTQNNKYILLSFAKIFKITYQGNWFADKEKSEMRAFWTINRITGKAHFFAYKMIQNDWRKAMKFMEEQYSGKIGKPNWDWISEVHNNFVKPNYDLFFKRIVFDCEKLKTKF